MKRITNNIRKTKLSYIIPIPVVKDEAQLLFAEAKRHIPFAVKRFYLITKVDKGAIRGLHSHRNLRQVLFCIQGSVTFILDNGSIREEVVLNKPNEGVFIDRWMWREMREFSDDAILLVLASEYYQESDYIRNYAQFLREVSFRKNRFSINSLNTLLSAVWSRVTNPFSIVSALRGNK